MKLTICNQGLKALTKNFGLTEYWANRITYVLEYINRIGGHLLIINLFFFNIDFVVKIQIFLEYSLGFIDMKVCISHAAENLIDFLKNF